MPLEQIDDGVWLAEGGLVSFYGIPYPTRSIIVRLSGSALWIWPISNEPFAGSLDIHWSPCPDHLYHRDAGARAKPAANSIGFVW
jgi:hypothetical protein